jgi:hypothetical protein
MPGWAISLLSVAIGAALGYLGSLHLQQRLARAKADWEAPGMFSTRLSFAVGFACEWPTTPGRAVAFTRPLGGAGSLPRACRARG